MLRLYDTLSREKKPFEPEDPKEARVYVCGPTVYDYSHLGHARCYVVYDVLIRHLRAIGQTVKYVRNITDIDDKILKRSAESGESPSSLTERFTAAFHEDMAALGNLPPDIEPKVSDHIPEIISMVQTLIDRGHAYESNGDVYFSVPSFEQYGRLSGRDLSQNAEGASERLDADQSARKKHAADFALWKAASDPNDPSNIASPWGPGRPGWHIECSAMSTKHLGKTLDLHGGGLDLVFPHHENEIAQSECATGATYCRHWAHNGFVEVDKQKMGKSLGNFFTARDLFERLEAEAVRLFALTVHYRSPLNLDWTLDDAGNVTGFPQIEDAESRLEYLYKTKQRLSDLPESRIKDAAAPPSDALLQAPERIRDSLNDDLNTPKVLAVMAEFLAAVNELCDSALKKKGKAHPDAVAAATKGFEALEAHIGIGGQDAGAVLTRLRDRRAAERGLEGSKIEAQIAARKEARANKDWAEGDRIRDVLLEQGVTLHDGTEGTTWTIA
ncbi:MAG: cysteine--tRNA ligase [Myxococcota bacterium]